jgi:hypothetical protein
MVIPTGNIQNKQGGSKLITLKRNQMFEKKRGD